MANPFRRYVLDAVLCSYDQFEARYMDKLGPKIDLTIDDVFRLVVPEEHRKLSKQAVEICGVEGLSQYVIKARAGKINIYHLDGTARWRRSKPFPFAWAVQTPKYYDAEVAERLNVWATASVETRREWKLGNAAIQSLYERCDTLQQMRYYFPAILTLLREPNTHTQNELADRVHEYSVPKKFVQLPPPLKDVLAKAQQNVTKALLLPPIKDKGHPAIDVAINEYSIGPTPWTNWVRPE